jgi:hypothetical protein
VRRSVISCTRLSIHDQKKKKKKKKKKKEKEKKQREGLLTRYSDEMLLLYWQQL